MQMCYIWNHNRYLQLKSLSFWFIFSNRRTSQEVFMHPDFIYSCLSLGINYALSYNVCCNDFKFPLMASQQHLPRQREVFYCNHLNQVWYTLCSDHYQEMLIDLSDLPLYREAVFSKLCSKTCDFSAFNHDAYSVTEWGNCKIIFHWTLTIVQTQWKESDQFRCEKQNF